MNRKTEYSDFTDYVKKSEELSLIDTTMVDTLEVEEELTEIETTEISKYDRLNQIKEESSDEETIEQVKENKFHLMAFADLEKSDELEKLFVEITSELELEEEWREAKKNDKPNHKT